MTDKIHLRSIVKQKNTRHFISYSALIKNNDVSLLNHQRYLLVLKSELYGCKYYFCNVQLIWILTHN